MFGGNILHSFNIPMQLTIHEIENRTKVGCLAAFSIVWLNCGPALQYSKLYLGEINLWENQGKVRSSPTGDSRRMRDVMEGESVGLRLKEK